MGFLGSMFGPSKDEIWSQVAAEIGGEYQDGGFWGKDELRCRSGEWEMVLDTYTVSTGKSSTTYTRMRAPFANKDGLYFKVYREGFFSGIGKLFGMQDIQIGDSFFDDAFVIKSNSAAKIQQLLNLPDVKRLIEAQPRISLEIKDDDGLFGASFPAGTDMLYFSCVGVIKEPVTLRRLFDLFATVLDGLVEIDSAYESRGNVRL